MPDQLFDTLTETVRRTPLSAAEVRRRGDRRRRRQQAAAGIAGLAAVTAIAAPLAFVTGGSQPDSAPPIASQGPSKRAQVVTKIPAAFPIDAGLSAPASEQPIDPANADALLALHVCSGPAGDALTWDATAGSDARAVTWSMPEGEGGGYRTVVAYRDEASARAALQGIADAVDSCQKATVGPRGPFPVAASEPAVGDQAYAFVDQFLDEDTGQPDGSGDLTVAIRVGNAVVVAQEYAMGVGDPAVVDQTAGLVTERLDGVVSAMESTFAG